MYGTVYLSIFFYVPIFEEEKFIYLFFLFGSGSNADPDPN
jgi:hypothetical protein